MFHKFLGFWIPPLTPLIRRKGEREREKGKKSLLIFPLKDAVKSQVTEQLSIVITIENFFWMLNRESKVFSYKLLRLQGKNKQ
jgi:hypothetical protein